MIKKSPRSDDEEDVTTKTNSKENKKTTTTTNDSDETSSSTTTNTETFIEIKPKIDAKLWTEPWFLAYWRPAAAWTYLVVTMFDFVLAPIFLGWYSIYTHSTLVMWDPLTIRGGGMFHLAFGAVLGIYTYGRTREKLAKEANGG